MADSDEDFVLGSSGDEAGNRRGADARRRAARAAKRQDPNAEPRRERWEDIQRSWDTVVEAADGSIAGTIVGLLEANKRKRLLRDTTPIQRGIIRHLTLILDFSLAMQEKDLRPTRFLLTLRYAREFITEFFEQNPISQLSILGMRDGLAFRISDMGGNPTEHLSALQEKGFGQEPKGSPSLQNALEMARAELFHAPSHGTREILLIFGALSSADPGDIHKTIASLVTDKIQVHVVGLAAQVAVCRELVLKTNNGNDSGYGVVLDEVHYRDLMMAATTPPVTKAQSISAASLLMMGFPSRIVEVYPSLCACHSNLTKGGYLCPRCLSKVCFLPTECPACSLTLILSTHLARSYHHLFPLKNWVEVPWSEAHKSSHCFSCQIQFPTPPTSMQQPGKPRHNQPNDTDYSDNTKKQDKDIASSAPVALPHIPALAISQRYACPDCRTHFCIDCDIFAHESLHNCPGCQSLPSMTIESRKKTKLVADNTSRMSTGSKLAEATKMLEKSRIVVGENQGELNNSGVTPMDLDGL